MQLTLETFINKLDFLTEEQKQKLIAAQLKIEETSERATKLDKFSALKLA